MQPEQVDKVRHAEMAYREQGGMDGCQGIVSARKSNRQHRSTAKGTGRTLAPATQTGAGGGGGRPPVGVSRASDGGWPWDDERHRRAHSEVLRQLQRRRDKPTGIGDLDDALRDLEEVRRGLGVRGLIDQEFKNFNDDELAIALLLSEEGRNVTALLESQVPGVKTADAAVGAVRTEFKTITGSEHRLRKHLQNAGDKAHFVVLDLRGTRISRSAAVRHAGAAVKSRPIQQVRVVGPRYDEMVP